MRTQDTLTRIVLLCAAPRKSANELCVLISHIGTHLGLGVSLCWCVDLIPVAYRMNVRKGGAANTQSNVRRMLVGVPAGAGALSARAARIIAA